MIQFLGSNQLSAPCLWVIWNQCEASVLPQHQHVPVRHHLSCIFINYSNPDVCYLRPWFNIKMSSYQCWKSRQSGITPNLLGKILATKFGVFFVIYIRFYKNTFNMSLMIIWWNIKVKWFPITEMWALKILRATICGNFLRKLTCKAGTN